MNDLEAGRPKKNPAEDHSHKDLRESVNVTGAPGGSSIIQVETLGRHGLLLLFLCAFIAAVSSVGFIFVLFELKTVSAQYQVLQYDQQALKAQLVAKGIYEGTEH